MTPLIVCRTHPSLVSSYLDPYLHDICKDPVPQKSHSEVLGEHEFGEHYSPHYTALHTCGSFLLVFLLCLFYAISIMVQHLPPLPSPMVSIIATWWAEGKWKCGDWGPVVQTDWPQVPQLVKMEVGWKPAQPALSGLRFILPPPAHPMASHFENPKTNKVNELQDCEILWSLSLPIV